MPGLRGVLSRSFSGALLAAVLTLLPRRFQLPIANGPVEGACKNPIKGRMECSGMRWPEEMAEAIGH